MKDSEGKVIAEMVEMVEEKIIQTGEERRMNMIREEAAEGEVIVIEGVVTEVEIGVGKGRVLEVEAVEMKEEEVGTGVRKED